MQKQNLLLFMILLSFSVIFWGSRTRAQAEWIQKVDESLLEITTSAEPVDFIVFLNTQADLSGAESLATKEAKGAFVYARLTAVARQTQPPLVDELEAAGVPYRQFWVTNMIAAQGDAAFIAKLARRPDVARIHANPTVQLDVIAPQQKTQSLAAVAWGVEKINAPAVWAEGVTGQGVVIGGQDTGFEWDHPALMTQYRGWDGATAVHSYNWHDAIHGDNPNTAPGNPCGFDITAPCDDHGHGTHTMGTMVGDDGAGQQIGVAPGVRWIGCRNMEQGWGSPASYSECYEWFIAPYPAGGNPFTAGEPDMAPHVINNSWSCPTGEGCTEPDVLRQVVENVRAAGILTVHAASNSGPGCSSITTPAAIYDASFTVGATDSSDEIAGFSSRGPVLVGDNSPAKPDISAPGVSIFSSYPGGSYGLSSGTSMAAPHVAGLAALLIAANPDLAGDVDAIEAAVLENGRAAHNTARLRRR